MFVDALLKLVDTQAVTASAAGNNVVDLGVAGKDMFVGAPMVVVIAPQTAAVATGTYSFQIQTSSDSAFTSPVSVGPAVTVPPAQMALGLQPIMIPFPYQLLLRYVRLYITTGGTSPSVTLNAYIEPADMVQKSRDYPKAYTVS